MHITDNKPYRMQHKQSNSDLSEQLDKYYTVVSDNISIFSHITRAAFVGYILTANLLSGNPECDSG